MVEYTTDANGNRVEVVRSGGTGRVIAIIAVIAAVIVAILFLTGFWSANVSQKGELPSVDVSAKGGTLPKVDLDSKEVVVGTKETAVTVPKVKTEKESIAVPVVGVKDNGEK